MFERGTEIVWVSYGPSGSIRREGIVRALIKPGRKACLPKRADSVKFKAAEINSVHTRYLVEVLRANKRSGRKLASHWLAPKAVTLDRVATVL